MLGRFATASSLPRPLRPSLFSRHVDGERSRPSDARLRVNGEHQNPKREATKRKQAPTKRRHAGNHPDAARAKMLRGTATQTPMGGAAERRRDSRRTVAPNGARGCALPVTTRGQSAPGWRPCPAFLTTERQRFTPLLCPECALVAGVYFGVGKIGQRASPVFGLHWT